MQTAQPGRLRFCGEPVTPEQLEVIRSVAGDCPGLSRTELAGTICEILGWQRPTGRLKTVECRALLEELDGSVLRLPPLRQGRPRGSRTSTAAAPGRAEPLLTGVRSDFGPVEIVPVAGKEDQALWRSLVEQHHYLGHRVPFGAHLRYFIRVHAPDPVIVGCLQFSSPAWRMEARDSYLRWDDGTRRANLQRVVCNSRFLILPSVRIKNLASTALSLACDRLADDWHERYGTRPLLLETLVDSSRYAGTCYKAANWIEAGRTAGRGRNDRDHARHGESPKTLFLYPLKKGAARLLRLMPGKSPREYEAGATGMTAPPAVLPPKRREHGRSEMVRKVLRKLLMTAGVAALFGCAPNLDALVQQSTGIHPQAAPRPHPAELKDAPSQIPLYTYEVVTSWPHYNWSFTQGLTFQDGLLLESSGLYERSALMKVHPGSGQVLNTQGVPGEYFAEGITVLRDKVYMLTLSGAGFIYDHKSLQRKGEFSFEGEGWGLTNDGRHLIMSNGSNRLKFVDPDTFKTERTVEVTCNGTPLKNLNALQYVKGEIYANVWRTDYIVRIDPGSGAVIGWINLKGLLKADERSGDPDHVLNGIAYDESNDRLVVTGKRWPRFFEIRLEKVGSVSARAVAKT